MGDGAGGAPGTDAPMSGSPPDGAEGSLPPPTASVLVREEPAEVVTTSGGEAPDDGILPPIELHRAVSAKGGSAAVSGGAECCSGTDIGTVLRTAIAASRGGADGAVNRAVTAGGGAVIVQTGWPEAGPRACTSECTVLRCPSV